MQAKLEMTKKKSSPAAMLDADADTDAECFMDFVIDVIAMFPFFLPTDAFFSLALRDLFPVYLISLNQSA